MCNIMSVSKVFRTFLSLQLPEHMEELVWKKYCSIILYLTYSFRHMSCEDCDPKGLVTVPNVALLSSVGLLESYPILNTSIPVLGRPLEIILELLNNGITEGEFKVDLWYTK